MKFSVVACALVVSFFVAFFAILIICFIIKWRQKRNLNLMPRALQMIAATPTCDGHYAYVYYDNGENCERTWGKKYSVHIAKYVSTENVTGYPNQLVTYNWNDTCQLFPDKDSDVEYSLEKLDKLMQNLCDYFALLRQQKHDLWFWPITDKVQFPGCFFSHKSCTISANDANLNSILNMLPEWVEAGNTLLPIFAEEIPAAGLRSVPLQMLVTNLERNLDKIKEYINSWKVQEIETCPKTPEMEKDISHILRDSDLSNKKPAVNLAGLTDAQLLSPHLQKKICAIARPVLTTVGFTFFGLAEKSLASLWKSSTGTIVPGSAFDICENLAKKGIVSCEDVVVAVLFSLFILSAAQYS